MSNTPTPGTLAPDFNHPRTVGDDIAPGSAVIEVHVRELTQLFNSMDPSPFLDKDLDVDAEEFCLAHRAARHGGPLASRGLQALSTYT